MSLLTLTYYHCQSTLGKDSVFVNIDLLPLSALGKDSVFVNIDLLPLSTLGKDSVFYEYFQQFQTLLFLKFATDL